MMELLLQSSVFLPIAGNLGNYYQLSGVPLSELKVVAVPKGTPTVAGLTSGVSSGVSRLNSERRSPSTIAFVRSRMLYAKAALNAKGGVRFGMRHIRRSSHLMQVSR